MLRREFPLGKTPAGAPVLQIAPATRNGDARWLTSDGIHRVDFSLPPRMPFEARLHDQLLERAREKATSRNANVLDWSPTLGADPEVFGARGETLIGARSVLPKRGVAFWDGVQAEFKVAPATCLEAIEGSIRGRLHMVAERYEQRARAQLIARSCVPLTDEYMQSASEQELLFGCNPSENAYGLQGRYASPRALKWRFAGGHWHFGGIRWASPPEAVKVLDQTLGLVGTALATRDNPVRRQFYGQAGEFRVPGRARLEYRTLSNFWIWHPALVHLTGMIGRGALALAQLGLDDVFGFQQREVVETINATDPRAALGMLHSAKKQFDTFFVNCGIAERNLDVTWRVLDDGIERFVEGDSFMKNWDYGNEYTSWNGYCSKWV
jgi:hypothetical protein